MTMMTQCRLERGTEMQVAWIEAKLATPDRIVDIRVDGEWERGWKVVKTGSTMPAKTVSERERDFKNHRKATDV